MKFFLKIFDKFNKTLRFIGRRTFIWFFISVCAAFCLSFVELSITAFLQLFLKTLGLLSAEVQMVWFLQGITLSLTQLGIFMLTIGVLKASGQFLASQSVLFANECMRSRLRLLVVYDMLKNDKNRFVSAGEVNFKLSEIIPKASAFCSICSALFSVSIQELFLAVFMFTTAWREALTGIIGIFFIGLAVLAINYKVREQANAIPHEQEALVSGIERVARNWLFIKVLRTEKREYFKLVSSIMRYSSHSIRATSWGNLGGNLPPLLGIFLLFIITILNLHFWHTPGMKYVAFLYLFTRFVQNLGSAASLFGEVGVNFPQFMLAAKYFFRFEKEKAAEAVALFDKVNLIGKISASFKDDSIDNSKIIKESRLVTPPALEIKNLYFSYSANSNTVITNLSLQVDGGKQLGIIGRSGSGKSTLLALIIGIIKPSKGSILLAGEDSECFFTNPENKIGYVGAEPFLIEGTIKENLEYGSSKPVSLEECEQALRDASLFQRITTLPEAMNYQLNENGDGLSAGEKQRLCLARALLSKPKILILDEASANLDDRTEAEIADSINSLKGRCTVIIVSHRTGFLKNADRIFDFATLTT